METVLPSVLIVDDEPAMRQLLQRLLPAAEWKVVVARSGEEGLAFAGGKGFDLILTDMKLPGMDGIELAKRVRETQPGVDVVLMTGAPSLESAIEALKGGLSDYLLKPFNPDAFRFVVDRWRRDWEFRRTLGQAQSVLSGALTDVFASVEKLLGSLPAGRERDDAAQVLARARELSRLLDGIQPPRRAQAAVVR